MRHFAITGIETASMISRIFFGDAMRATPPSARICAGTRSSAITAQAPDRSAISAWRASVTSMMTPPFSISAKPVFSRRLPAPFDDPLFVAMTENSFLLQPFAVLNFSLEVSILLLRGRFPAPRLHWQGIRQRSGTLALPQMLGEHSGRIDSDEQSATLRQHLALFIQDARHI